jgi:hypothetical protein
MVETGGVLADWLRLPYAERYRYRGLLAGGLLETYLGDPKAIWFLSCPAICCYVALIAPRFCPENTGLPSVWDGLGKRHV